jgi:RNA-directed DNA polymerase
MNAFQGLLEPYARITCTCGSEGSGAQQCAPLTRLISPLLLNITLQGIEEAAGTRYYKNGKLVPGTPAVIVYADDLVALCHSRQQAETVQERLVRQPHFAS